MADITRCYGLLLPHLGEQAGRDRLIRGAQAAERYGCVAMLGEEVLPELRRGDEA